MKLTLLLRREPVDETDEVRNPRRMKLEARADSCEGVAPLLTKIRHGILSLKGLYVRTPAQHARYCNDAKMRLNRTSCIGASTNFGLADDCQSRKMLRQLNLAEQ